MKKFLYVFFIFISSFSFINNARSETDADCTNACRKDAGLVADCLREITKAEGSSARAIVTDVIDGHVGRLTATGGYCECRCGGFNKAGTYREIYIGGQSGF